MRASSAVIGALRPGEHVRARSAAKVSAGEFCHPLKGRPLEGFFDAIRTGARVRARPAPGLFNGRQGFRPRNAQAWAYARDGRPRAANSGRVSRAQAQAQAREPLEFRNASRADTYAHIWRLAFSAGIAGMSRHAPLGAIRPEFLESIKRGKTAPARREFSESIKRRAAAAGTESAGGRPSLHPRRKP